MFRRNVSGQFAGFTLVSAISGNPVTGASGAISGRKAIDGLSGMIVLSGNIIELGGGGYRANLFDFDTDGNNIYYLFTASGCVPCSYLVTTTQNVSGALWLASGQSTAINSGQSVLVYSGQLSGQVINWLSGQNVGLLSGMSVLVYSGQISGQRITADVRWISGAAVDSTVAQIGTDLRLISGAVVDNTVAQIGVNLVTAVSGVVQIASGPFVVANLASGTTFLASGQAVSLNSGQIVGVYSGNLSGQRITWLSGQTVTINSGMSVLVYSGQLSGQRMNSDVRWISGADVDSTIAQLGTDVRLISGAVVDSTVAQLGTNVVTANSGVVQIASGPFVVANLASGTTFLASGSAVNLLSGNVVGVYSGNLSGQRITWLSGQTVTINSGQFVLVYSGQLSGQVITWLSGQNVGLLSGQSTIAVSGLVYLASGLPAMNASGAVTVVTNLDKSGYAVQSGDVYPASGVIQATVTSGSVFLASGQAVNLLSGNTVLLYSGQRTLPYSGQLSGQFVAVQSGQVFLNSGYDTDSIPRGVWRVNMSGMSGEADYSPLNAIRKLRNTWQLSGTTLEVMKEDGTTVAYSQTAVAQSGVQPVTGLN